MEGIRVKDFREIISAPNREIPTPPRRFELNIQIFKIYNIGKMSSACAWHAWWPSQRIRGVCTRCPQNRRWPPGWPPHACRRVCTHRLYSARYLAGHAHASVSSVGRIPFTIYKNHDKLYGYLLICYKCSALRIYRFIYCQNDIIVIKKNLYLRYLNSRLDNRNNLIFECWRLTRYNFCLIPRFNLSTAIRFNA